MLKALFQGVYGKLSADTGVEAKTTRIYPILAPEDAPKPYILVTIAAGGTLNETPRDELDVWVDVKAVAASMPEALDLAGLIRTALHEQDLSLGGSWKTVRCQHMTPWAFQVTEDARQYWQAGGTYRIRAVVEVNP